MGYIIPTNSVRLQGEAAGTPFQPGKEHMITGHEQIKLNGKLIGKRKLPAIASVPR